MRCIKFYLKPSIRKHPDYIVLQVGIINFDPNRSPDLIAKSIVYIASSMKNENYDVTISNISSWADYFKAKASELNKHLSKLLVERNLHLVDHLKTLKTRYLNGSRSHLNRKGAPILQATLCKFLSKFFNWRSERNNAEIATRPSTAL